MRLPRFLNQWQGYEVVDVKEWIKDGKIDIYLTENEDAKEFKCHRCSSELGVSRGKHKMRLECMPILGLRVFLHFWRRKGECSKCNKVRSQSIEFICPESPHLTQDFGWWLGRICEIAAVSRAAELLNQDEYTTWRQDFKRMRRLLQTYKIPEVHELCVDEVYARRKLKNLNESRNDLFFTVITDLKTRKVVWVSEGRSQAALEEFYKIIGEEQCKKIKLVAMDQFEGYADATKKYCSQATIIWDKYHILQNFEVAINEQRKQLHEQSFRGSEIKKLTRGKYRFLFLKRASRRTLAEKQHIDDVLKNNEDFAKLEIIKEKMLTFFDQPNLKDAKKVFEDVGDWIAQANFKHLWRWHNCLEHGWDTLKNYFTYRVTNALAEGMNNVIKTLKRSAYGYRNMAYFKLKIMQKCGYLNSRHISLMIS